MGELDLAFQIVDLARSQVLARNHFLSAAVGRLGLEPAVLGEPFVTDGYKLYFDPGRVIARFRQERIAPEHDLLHSVVHCLFLHPYVGPAVNPHLWDLACDLVSERIVAELIGPRPTARGARLTALASRMEREMGRRASAEALYARLCQGAWADEARSWWELVHSDDHTAWYAFSSSGDSLDDASGAGGQGSFKASEAARADGSALRGASASSAADGAAPNPSADEGSDSRDGSSASDGGHASESHGSAQGAAAPSEPASASSEEAGRLGGSCEPSDSPRADRDQRGEGLAAAASPLSRGSDPGGIFGLEVLTREGLRMRELSRPSIEQQMDEWRQVATSLLVSLQATSARCADGSPGFAEDLVRLRRRREDYAGFLRQFATFGEAMRVSDDEFDAIFYTYGMEVYGNMPLVEPLEYREEKRIREFVVVIDTSGSVSGEIVRGFAETTFSLLRSTESFFQKVHLRIIQCDAQVQSDDRISSMEELEEWGDKLRIRGCGGTDFRPAFEYVDALVEGGGFSNLGGLIYFTDGEGTYPDWMPSYKSAFIFYGQDHADARVPAWAVQMALEPEDLNGNERDHAQGGAR